jgi:hypothetical protein
MAYEYCTHILAAQQFSTGLGLRASCQHAAEKALGGGRSREYRPPVLYTLCLSVIKGDRGQQEGRILG